MTLNQRPIQPKPAPPSKYYVGDPIPWKSLLIFILGAAILLSIVLEYRTAQASQEVNCLSAKAVSYRYISPWTQIQPKSSYTFKHGFKCQPLEMDVWATNNLGQPVAPVYETDGLHVIAVSSSEITIENKSAFSIWVQVIAKQ